jgi:hypothetical protein
MAISRTGLSGAEGGIISGGLLKSLIGAAIPLFPSDDPSKALCCSLSLFVSI